METIELLRKSNSNSIAESQEGKWSPVQIVAHLIISEKIALQYMKKKFLGIDASPATGILEATKFILLKISQRLPLKYKAPKVLGEHDPPALTLAELELEWNQSRAELATFLEQFNAITIKNQVYKHPLAGKLNIIQGVGFMREHIIHHLPQIKSRVR